MLIELWGVNFSDQSSKHAPRKSNNENNNSNNDDDDYDNSTTMSNESNGMNEKREME